MSTIRFYTGQDYSSFLRDIRQYGTLSQNDIQGDPNTWIVTVDDYVTDDPDVKDLVTSYGGELNAEDPGA